MILVYMYYRALTQRKHKPIPVYPQKKLVFWSSILILAGLFVSLWCLIDPFRLPVMGYWSLEL